MRIERVVSGGRTGADRAALDRARDHGVPHEGLPLNVAGPRASGEPAIGVFVRELLEGLPVVAGSNG